MSRRRPTSLALLAIASLVAAACGPGPSGREPADELAAGFARPPDSARPWVYWMWMDGNLTREGITADLEAMRAAGIGGVIIMEVNVGVPRGPVKFMSAEWRALFKHVVREAERLGLEITLNAGPGWTGTRRPVGQARSSPCSTSSPARSRPSGPARFDAVLPRPPRRPAFFGEGGLPPELKKTDGRVLPRRGRAGLSDARRRTADRRHRREGPLCPGALFLAAGRQAVPARPGRFPRPAPPERRSIPARVVDLTDKLSADGRLAWDVPAGRWTDPSLRPDDHGRQHAPGPGAGPRARVRQARRGRPRRPLRRVRRRAAPRDRPPPDGRRGGLDDAAHRQLGDGRPELDGRLPRGIPAAARLRSPALPAGRHRPAGRKPGDLRALPLGPAPDRPGAGHREPRRASQGARPPRRLRPVHRALRHDAAAPT